MKAERQRTNRKRNSGNKKGRKNGFMLMEALLALVILCLSAFLLASSMSALQVSLHRGVSKKIEVRDVQKQIR